MPQVTPYQYGDRVRLPDGTEARVTDCARLPVTAGAAPRFTVTVRHPFVGGTVRVFSHNELQPVTPTTGPAQVDGRVADNPLYLGITADDLATIVREHEARAASSRTRAEGARAARRETLLAEAEAEDMLAANAAGECQRIFGTPIARATTVAPHAR